MRGILKKLYIDKNKLLFFLIIFFFSMVFLSYIYYTFFYNIIELEIPTPNGKKIYLKFSNADIIFMTINGLIKNDNLIIVNDDPQLDYYANRINNIIEKYKEEYLYYNKIFTDIYPERYFYFCIDKKCSLYFFSSSGLLKVENSDLENKSFLYFWISKNYLNKILNDIQNNNGSDLPYLIKQGLINGDIKIKNPKTVVEEILRRYSKNVTLQMEK